MVDASSGVAASDQAVADMLRRTDKPVWLVANKIDGQNVEIVLSSFWARFRHASGDSGFPRARGGRSR